MATTKNIDTKTYTPCYHARKKYDAMAAAEDQGRAIRASSWREVSVALCYAQRISGLRTFADRASDAMRRARLAERGVTAASAEDKYLELDRQESAEDEARDKFWESHPCKNTECEWDGCAGCE